MEEHPVSPIDQCLQDPKLLLKIFIFLEQKKLSECALTCKIWLLAVREIRKRGHLVINPSLIKRLEESNKDTKTNPTNIDEYIKKYFDQCSSILVRGYVKISSRCFDNFFDVQDTLKKLVIRGPGAWTVCRCPSGLSSEDDYAQPTSNLKELQIGTTFKISACALLSLISKCPKLKKLVIYGIIVNEEHLSNFDDVRFETNLANIHWPYFSKAPSKVLKCIIERSNKIDTLFAPETLTLTMLQDKKLQNLVSLALNLSDKWSLIDIGSNFNKKKQIAYLVEAKRLEYLELRSHIFYDNPEDNDISDKVKNSVEQYQVAIWAFVSELESLKAMTIFGDWPLCSICRELAKRAFEIDYLRINLQPQNLRESLIEADEPIIYNAPDAIMALKKLPKLKYFMLSCSEKLENIDSTTASYLRDLINSLYILDMKVNVSAEVFTILTLLHRRSKQTGKLFRMRFSINFHPMSEYSNLIMEVNLDFPTNGDVGEHIRQLARDEVLSRTSEKDYVSLSLWHLKLISIRDNKEEFENLEAEWNHFFGTFEQDLSLQM